MPVRSDIRRWPAILHLLRLIPQALPRQLSRRALPGGERRAKLVTQLTYSAHTAGDIERFAGDPGRVAGGQKHGGGGDILRLADPAQGRLRLDLAAEVALRD